MKLIKEKNEVERISVNARITKTVMDDFKKAKSAVEKCGYEISLTDVIEEAIKKQTKIIEKFVIDKPKTRQRVKKTGEVKKPDELPKAETPKTGTPEIAKGARVLKTPPLKFEGKETLTGEKPS